MIRLFITELKKIKRRHIWLIYLAALAVICLWLTWAMGKMAGNGRLEGQGYYYLLGGIPLMNSIFLPTIIACAQSRLCDIELKGNTFKLLCTMQRHHSIYHVKLVLGFLYLLFFTLAEVMIMPVFCKINHLEESMPADLTTLFFLSTLTVSTVLMILQQSLSLLSDNQLFPLFFGVGGTFVGLFSWFFPNLPIRYFLPWGYYCVLLTVGQNYEEAARTVTWFPVSFPWVFFGGFLVFGVLVYLAGKKKFMDKEV